MITKSKEKRKEVIAIMFNDINGLINLALVGLIIFCFFKYGIKSILMIIFFVCIVAALIHNPEYLDFFGHAVLDLLKRNIED